MICSILIARKGSTGFPGKNIFPVLGRPLCEYPLLAAINSKRVDKYFLSTDDEELMKLARKHGVQVIHRPPELATNEALGEDAYVHAYNEIRDNHLDGNDLEFLVLLMGNSPTILAETIDLGIDTLRNCPELDSAVTVSRYNMWGPLRARKIEPDGTLQPVVPFEAFAELDAINCDRDSNGDVWFADMGVSIVRPYCLENIENGLLPQKWMGQKIHPLKQWGGLDVDYQWQIPLVEFWLKKHGFSEDNNPYV
jgi:hypothetical protein